jgi:hypothetical protein
LARCNAQPPPVNSLLHFSSLLFSSQIMHNFPSQSLRLIYPIPISHSHSYVTERPPSPLSTPCSSSSSCPPAMSCPPCPLLRLLNPCQLRRRRSDAQVARQTVQVGLGHANAVIKTMTVKLSRNTRAFMDVFMVSGWRVV